MRFFSGSGGGDEPPPDRATSAEFWVPGKMISLPTLLAVLMDGAGASQEHVSKLLLEKTS